MNEPECPGCLALLQRVAQLETQLAELTRKLEEATRAGKRQAAPFRKGPPEPNPKTPGRKSGDAHGKHAHRPPPPPDQITERHEAPLPDDCPRCHGPLVETEIVEQFQTDIPRKPVIRQFRIHVGRCSCCGRRTRGRHPLQTSDAIGSAASQIGPDAQAAATLLHTQHGLSHGKVSSIFEALFGFKLTRGASCRIGLRTASRLETDYQQILRDLRRDEQIAADETGWRVGGSPAWLHVWVGGRATAYAIDSRRSAEALERVIGLGWSGILSHDGYATYDRFAKAVHQSCVAHVLRRARDLLAGAAGMARRFPQQVIALFTEAVHRRNEHLRGRITLETLQERRDDFDIRLMELVLRPRGVADHARLAKHLGRHLEQWFTFVSNPWVEATNWLAEQAIRPAVVNRKVWGGNRTQAGSKAQGILMSVLETVRRTSRSVVDYVSESLRAFGNPSLAHPVLLTGR